MHNDLKAHLKHSNGLIVRGRNPELATRIDRSARAGELRRVLPGVYAAADLAADWRTLAAAATLWDPDAVIVCEAAAALSFRPRLVPRSVEVASSRAVGQWPGFSFTRRSVPTDFVRHHRGIRLADPALTAIDLVSSRGGDAIDWALASRMVSLKRMYQALAASPNRRGNQDRRLMLLDSRSEPWSAAERLAHRILRAAGIGRWRANVATWCDGNRYFLDILFLDCRLVIEIDGWEFHSKRDAFEDDRRRGNILALHGYQVLHFTWRMLDEEPDWVVDTIRRALARHGIR